VKGRLLADEHFPVQIVYRLRRLGYEVTTVREIGSEKSGDSLPDDQVLQHAIRHKTAVVTKNVKHFSVLHGQTHGRHYGIIACSFSDYDDPKRIAKTIDEAISSHGGRLKGKWVRITRSDVTER
jgi:hypothetical protein